MPTPAKLAVLIDADNASPAAINSLLDEVATYGSASVKRIYGDWTSTHGGFLQTGNSITTRA
jgi:hypothetical protein